MGWGAAESCSLFHTHSPSPPMEDVFRTLVVNGYSRQAEEAVSRLPRTG